jgi:predicted DNA-binding ribbon-helix-helix protein
MDLEPLPEPPAEEPDRWRRSLMINGRRTSVCLEPAVWDGLSAIATLERATLGEVLEALDRCRGTVTLASAIRVFSLCYWRALAEARRAGSDAPGMLAPAMTAFAALARGRSKRPGTRPRARFGRV